MDSRLQAGNPAKPLCAIALALPAICMGGTEGGCPDLASYGAATDLPYREHEADWPAHLRATSPSFDPFMDHGCLEEMLQSEASAAGPQIAELLNHPNWGFRLRAAQALGSAGNHSVSHHLIALLDDPRDVRLHWVAAEGLGKLQAHFAVPQLNELAQNHWYPPVREVAKQALDAISNSDLQVSDRVRPAKRGIDYWVGIGHGMRICDQPVLVRVPKDQGKRSGLKDRSQLEALSYEVMVQSFVADHEITIELDAGKVTIGPGEIVPARLEMQQPYVGLQAEEGWLLWGGRRYMRSELLFRHASGQQQIISYDSVENFYRLGEHYVAVVNVSMNMGGYGMLRMLENHETEGWAIANWRALPSSVAKSALVETGELLLDLRDGGSILVAADGSMRMMPCAAETQIEHATSGDTRTAEKSIL